jgi:hypothetical protein
MNAVNRDDFATNSELSILAVCLASVTCQFYIVRIMKFGDIDEFVDRGIGVQARFFLSVFSLMCWFTRFILIAYDTIVD